jgi:hypothetical protein
MVSFAEAYSAAIDWAKEDLLRPGLILVCGMLLFNLPTLLYKIRMFFRGILYFVLCWDKSWKKPQDPGAIFGPHLSQGLPVERKTVYFVRHGESTWNDTFNKGHHRSTAVFVIGFIPGLVKATLYELYLLLSGKLDRYVSFVRFSNLDYRTAYCICLLYLDPLLSFSPSFSLIPSVFQCISLTLSDLPIIIINYSPLVGSTMLLFPTWA